MTLRVWFNRTYATNAHVIEMIRANPDGRAVYVLGTHPDPDSPVLVAADEAHPEPDVDAAEYLAWALEFAREHRVDILVPRLHMAELADAREQFAAVGTRLLCAAGETVRLFADKQRAYRAAAALGLPVPPHHLVTDAAGLRAAYAELSADGGNVCMKPTHGVGGAGYRMLTTAPPRLSDFTGSVRARASVDAVCHALEASAAAGQNGPELLVMPYLTGPEISVDVLATAEGYMLAAVGRGRSRRRRLIIDDPDANDVARRLVAAHRVGYLSNTQVRYWQASSDDAPRPYLLELNTRISGGLFQTAIAGVNLPWRAITLALGEPHRPVTPEFGGAFTTIAALVPLS